MAGAAAHSLYADKVILAPMVRVGTLPFRLLAAHYGAQLTYTEEIVDLKLARTTRRVNPDNGSVEYVYTEVRQKKKGPADVIETLVFSTEPREARTVPVVLQLGTAAPETAVAAALHVAADVDAIDVNMGCPKKFSLQGGMGAALLRDPDRVRRILTALVAAAPCPVSCKVRILEDRAATVALLRTVLDCGAAAVAVHPRVPAARTEAVAADYAELRAVLAELGRPDVPFILSGDVLAHDQIGPARRATGVASVMLARGALRNPSVFAATPEHPALAATRFLGYCDRYPTAFSNVKYTLTRAFEGLREFAALHQDLLGVRTNDEARAALAAALAGAPARPPAAGGGDDGDGDGAGGEGDAVAAEQPAAEVQAEAEDNGEPMARRQRTA